MANATINPRGFHTHGKEFFSAAEAVYASKKHSILPLAFLWGRSIELLIKSFLLSEGVSIERLRSKKFGHNLVALHKEAAARGLEGLIGSDPVNAGLMRCSMWSMEAKDWSTAKVGRCIPFLTRWSLRKSSGG